MLKPTFSRRAGTSFDAGKDAMRPKISGEARSSLTKILTAGTFKIQHRDCAEIEARTSVKGRESWNTNTCDEFAGALRQAQRRPSTTSVTTKLMIDPSRSMHRLLRDASSRRRQNQVGPCAPELVTCFDPAPTRSRRSESARSCIICPHRVRPQSTAADPLSPSPAQIT